MKNYNIKQDILYINFIRSKPNLSEATILQYETVLNKFCRAVNQPLSEIIKNCKEQQDKVTEKTTSKTTDKSGNTIIEKSITRFDVNSPDSYINIYLNTHLNYCLSRNNRNRTVNHDFSHISSFLNYYNVELPRMERYNRDTQEWHLLSKEDFKFILSDSTITHASLIKHLMSTGMRLKDALNLTIGDYMQATSEHHNYADVNEFIDNAPQNMIATYDFYPEKTKKFKTRCITFSDPETNNLIIQNLRKIKNETLPAMNKKLNSEFTISKSDALFASKKQQYKGPLSPHSVSDIFYKKNKKLKKHHIQIIEDKIKKGELSIEDKQKEIDKIPKFHAHGCRKYFQTMISRNCGNLRICAVMEGHVSPIKTDSSYIKHEIEEVKEAYMMTMPDLSLENTETKVYTSDARREMEEKISVLEKELEAKNTEVQVVNERVDLIETVLGELGIENIVDKVKKE